MNKEELNSLLENVARSIYKIEVDLRMPINTLQKAMKGERMLPKRWAIALRHYVSTKQYILDGKAYVPKKESEQTIEIPTDNENGLTAFQIYQRKKMGLK